MSRDAGALARRLAKIQAHLREELINALINGDQELEDIFDPYSYSTAVHDLRDKYLSRLFLIQGILQQLAHCSQPQNKQSTRVITVAAEDRNKLAELVNDRLGRLTGAKVLDVKFMPATDSSDWSALIMYEMNPFVGEAGGTAAWM